MKYDVFISSKSEDYPLAEQVYDFLVNNGLKAFLACRELDKLGEAQYSFAIGKAIDESKHMIVVASSLEHINSKWVAKEWSVFDNDLNSNYRTGNLLTILTNNVQLRSLPAGLRHQQSFSIDNYKQHILSYLQQDEIELKERLESAYSEIEKLNKNLNSLHKENFSLKNKLEELHKVNADNKKTIDQLNSQINELKKVSDFSDDDIELMVEKISKEIEKEYVEHTHIRILKGIVNDISFVLRQFGEHPLSEKQRVLIKQKKPCDIMIEKDFLATDILIELKKLNIKAQIITY